MTQANPSSHRPLSPFSPRPSSTSGCVGISKRRSRSTGAPRRQAACAFAPPPGSVWQHATARLACGTRRFWQGEDTLLIPAAILRARLERFATLDHEVPIRLVEGKAPRPSFAAFQPLADRELPWVVEAAPLDATRLYAGADQRRRIYLTML